LKKKYELSRSNVIQKWAKNYPKVMTWLAKLQKKEQNAWNLWLYCKITGKTPDELLSLKSDPQSKEAEYLVDKFVADETLGLTNSVKVSVTISVKSFYKHNYSELAKASGQITFLKKYPYRKHTKEELLKIYRATQNPRDRSLITFVWSTSIAKESLTHVTWKHLDIDWEKQDLPHIGLPDRIIKGHGIGKYKGVEQHTFLTPEAKKDLIDYRDWVERIKGVKLSLEDPVFIDLHPPYDAIKLSSLTKLGSVLSKRSGVPFGWHDARRYVETALEEIKIHPNWARKIRGRKVKGEEAPYSRPAIEQLRAAYREAVPLLQFTSPTDLDYMRQRQEASETITAKILAGEPLTEEDKLAIQKFGLKLKERRPKYTNGGDCGEQFEQIAEAQLLSYLRSGWSIVKELQSGDVIVKR